MQRIHTTCLIFLLFAPRLQAQETVYSLAELRGLAGKNHESVQAALLDMRQAELAGEIAASGRLPRLDLEASYTRVSETGAITFEIPGLLSRTIRFGDGNIYDAGITASVPLFTGFRIHLRQRIEEERARITESAYSASVVELKNLVALRYCTAQLALRRAAIADEQRRYLAEHLRVRKAFLASGQALAFDTLLLTTRLHQIALEKAKAGQQYDESMLQLGLLTGLEGTFGIEEAMDVRTDLEESSLDQLAERAYGRRHEINTLERTASMQELSARAVEGGYLPSIHAAVSYRYGRPGVDQIMNEWMDYYTAGLRLEWNLWSWGGDRKSAERHRIEGEKTGLRLSQLRREIRTRIASLLDELAVHRMTLDLLDAQVAQEEEKRRLVDARIAEGWATVGDVVEAESSLTTAMLQREQVRINRALSLIDLANTVGEEL